MSNRCGQSVGRTSINLGKIRARLSPYLRRTVHPAQYIRAQLPLSHNLSVSFTPHLSPTKTSALPLIEHYLYPVSTAPIINPNQIN